MKKIFRLFMIACMVFLLTGCEEKHTKGIQSDELTIYNVLLSDDEFSTYYGVTREDYCNLTTEKQVKTWNIKKKYLSNMTTTEIVRCLLSNPDFTLRTYMFNSPSQAFDSDKQKMNTFAEFMKRDDRMDVIQKFQTIISEEYEALEDEEYKEQLSTLKLVISDLVSYVNSN